MRPRGGGTPAHAGGPGRFCTDPTVPVVAVPSHPCRRVSQHLVGFSSADAFCCLLSRYLSMPPTAGITSEWALLYALCNL